MPTYVLPQVLVFQDFAIVPAAVANPLRAHISGPHAQLIRYAEEDERDDGKLDYYDNLLATSFSWPNRPAGGINDASYTKVWMKDALLKYFEDTIGQGSVITKLSGYNNRVRSATRSFADNGDDYPRYSGLLDRDVQVGDVAKVRGLDGDSNPITLWTYVKKIHGDEVASEVGTASADASNAGAQSASSTVTKIAGADNCVSIAADESAYDGLAAGYVTETYDVLVTAGSVNSDYTTATLRIISGSGTDDQTAVTPAAKGVAFDIGTRGLQITIDELDTDACSESADSAGVSADDLIAGQRWTVTVHQAWTEPVPTSSGTFDSANDTTYIVTVSRGGLYAGETKPQIKVSTTNGIDLSGPTTVSAAATDVAVGTLGVEIQFSGTGLRKGDRYYIECTGTTVGPMRVLELGHNLSSDIEAGSEVDLTLYIRKSVLQIPKNRIGYAPLTNWDVTDTEITINDGIVAYDESWTDDGTQEPLEVFSESSKKYGMLYVETRYWLQGLCHEVGTISDPGDLNTLISGPLDPDNPLKWGVHKALENANGVEVKFTSVCNPDDDDSWADVLELLLGRDDVYGLVPLTRKRTVLDLYAAHVKNQSSPEQGLWRAVWVNLEGVPEIPVVAAGSSIPGHTEATTSDGEVALGKVTDDPDTSGSQYTILQCTSSNADFLTNGVRAGDVVRLLYTSDGFGNEEYSEYVVDEVDAEDQLRLLTGPDAPINTAAKFEIWRNLTATEEADVLAVNAGSWGDRRVRATWPDKIESSGTVMEGYFLNCSLAALCSGVLPHQGLTHLQIVGYSSVPRTTSKFNRSQLDKMALGGTWIVTQDLTALDTSLGQIFTRHAVTTGSYDDLNEREEMLTRNVDSISYRFKDIYRPYIGVTNVTPSMQYQLGVITDLLIQALKTESATTQLGGQLIDATVVELRPHLLLKDRYVIRLDCSVPYPFNNVEVHLTI